MKGGNKKIVVVVILCILALAFGLANALPSIMKNWYERVDSYRDISVVEAYAIITYQPYRNVVVLDVRSHEEYEVGYIEGAINIEWTELEANLSDPTSVLYLYENDTIIVNCKTGGRSANASEVLATYNFKIVYNMVGGIDAWKFEGYPTVTEASPTYTDIDVHEAYGMIFDDVTYPDLVILDVRTSGYDLSHIGDAINIPYFNDADFGNRLGPLAGHENHEIIVYCTDSSCTKAQLASQYLVDHGFTKVYHMLGGLNAWVAAGYPVWTPDGAQFQIKLSAGVGGTTDPTPGVHLYEQGSPVTLEAFADASYVFDHWESAISGQFYSSANPWSFNMPSYHFTVYAVFVTTP